jgi:hypothetical protein
LVHIVAEVKRVEVPIWIGDHVCHVAVTHSLKLNFLLLGVPRLAAAVRLVCRAVLWKLHEVERDRHAVDHGADFVQVVGLLRRGAM